MSQLGIENLIRHEVRVELTPKMKEKLWIKIDEKGGIQEISKNTSYSATKIYNWKNKELSIPIKFIEKILGKRDIKQINSIKGEGKSKKWKIKPPIDISDKLLTRINAQIKTNEEGTPFYITKDEQLAKRFTELLNNEKIPNSVYRNQNRYEVQYPKYVHNIITSINFETDLTALADEKGKIKGKNILVDGEKVKLSELGKLYSKDKRLEKALKTGRSEEVEEIIKEQVSKVANAL